MVNLEVINWRCIEDLKMELAKVNVFIGPNSTGKSSLAYAIYFASKSRAYDPQPLLTQLYGCDFSKIARLVENKPQFPISIKIGGSELSIRPSKGEHVSEFEITRPLSSPWADEYLLPSNRISYIKIMMWAPKIVSRLKATPEAPLIGSFIWGLFELFKTLPLFPPFGAFASDYTRALTGLRLEPVKGELEKVGSYTVNIHPLISFTELVLQDPYVNLKLPVELAPDGLLDFSIFDSMTQKIPENSLIVIEEPEIHKNPLMVMEFTKRVIERVLDKKFTLIMTTHSDIPLITMANLVVKKTLKSKDVRIYYLKRDPWTKCSKIELYEDGTLENLPDTEELITHLF